LYPETQDQSSPEPPPERRPTRPLGGTVARAMLWFVGVATFLTLAVYAVGGSAMIRRVLQLRTRAFTRIEQSLQPPTQADMAAAAARAVRDTASVLAKDKPPSASAAFIVTSVLVVILLAFSAFYLSGRRARVREGR
jgi:hypothetical protein